MKRIKAIAIALTGIDQEPTTLDYVMTGVYVVIGIGLLYVNAWVTVLDRTGAW